MEFGDFPYSIYLRVAMPGDDRNNGDSIVKDNSI